MPIKEVNCIKKSLVCDEFVELSGLEPSTFLPIFVYFVVLAFVVAFVTYLGGL